jgi:hypothetical protein
MIAYLGLASQPADVQSISADRVTLLSATSYPPGSRMAVELVNTGRSFKCVLALRVDGVQPNPEGGYRLEAEFSHRLTADELRDLAS